MPLFVLIYVQVQNDLILFNAILQCDGMYVATHTATMRLCIVHRRPIDRSSQKLKIGVTSHHICTHMF